MSISSVIAQAIETTANLVGTGIATSAALHGFVDVREPHTGKLLFRIHPKRWIIEIQTRGIKTVVDLEQYLCQRGD